VTFLNIFIGSKMILTLFFIKLPTWSGLLWY